MRIGIDIGSTTVKVVLLDDQDNTVFHTYERHMSKVREKTAEMLRLLSPRLSGQAVQVAVTGSAGLGVAKAADLEFVQEVFATAGAVERFIPDIDVVVELGGEDAKIIFLTGGLEERMNGSCAGGTGAFIDQMATLLGITADELDRLSLGYEKLYAIASRCGVFAKSDIQPLLNQGARKEDIAASIFQAVVNQTITGLAQGRQIGGKVLFLGGPLFFLEGLRRRFVETLHLSPENAVFPENADVFVAVGAACYAANSAPMDFDDLLERIEHASAQKNTTNTLEPLFISQDDYDAFLARHNAHCPPPMDADSYQGDAYLGIDAGSATTKLVLISPDGGLLYSYYASNEGNPVSVVLGQLREIYRRFGDRIVIRGSASTGYGEDLVKSAFHIDRGLVETVAHYRAARHFNPDVDFIIDIGGQDAKVIRLDSNGQMVNFGMNEKCAAGTGRFLEVMARVLGCGLGDLSDLAKKSDKAVSISSVCTVFAESEVISQLAAGETIANVARGAHVAIAKRVAGMCNRVGYEPLVVMTGGVALNEDMVDCMSQELGVPVQAAPDCQAAGAIGAAVAAYETYQSKNAE